MLIIRVYVVQDCAAFAAAQFYVDLQQLRRQINVKTHVQCGRGHALPAATKRQTSCWSVQTPSHSCTVPRRLPMTDCR